MSPPLRPSKSHHHRLSATRARTLLLFLILAPLLLFLTLRSIHRNPFPSSVPSSYQTTTTHQHLPVAELDCAAPKRLGDAYGGWILCQPLQPHAFQGALVYTVGVGRNIEWDKAMITAYATVHHGWDPTPTALDFTQKKEMPQSFHFHPVGLAATDGNLTLKLPTGNQDSYTVMEFRNSAQQGTVVDVPVLSLPSMLASLNHSRLAILKIDIEGAEFDVIDQWSAQRYTPPTDQLLIEFHERYFMHQSAWRNMVPDAIAKLDRLGFQLITRTKLEITFANRQAIAKSRR